MTLVKLAVTVRSKAPGQDVGVTEVMIHNLVHAFYARVRRDPVLGPIFEAHVRDWPDHLGKLCAFWSSVTLLSDRYKGKPIPAHAQLAEIGNAHFALWLRLFIETAGDVCPAPAAALFVDRSQRIAQSLQLGLAFHRGLPPDAHPHAS